MLRRVTAALQAVSCSAVAKWEANNGLPDVDNLKALARLLSLSVDYLLDDSEEAWLDFKVEGKR